MNPHRTAGIINRIGNHDGIALRNGDSGETLHYSQLRETADEVRSELDSTAPGVVFCLVDLSIAGVIAYLGALSSGHCVCLLDAEIDESMLESLLQVYDPDWVIASGRDARPAFGFQRQACLFEKRIDLYHRNATNHLPIDSLNKLLLPTSGSTGNPKMVRLSNENLAANAESIAEYLQLDETERPIASLPFHYSYGLSVLHSHLISGGCLVLTSNSIMQPGFWDTFQDNRCTSFAGVPFQYSALLRVGFEKMDLQHLKTMTQAGGKLSEKIIARFHALSIKKGFRLFIMFGQTEATARISFLTPESLPAKLGSVGKAIPGGFLTLQDDKGQDARRGQVIYRGENVSLGYAHKRADLGLGNERQGELRTGDIGYFDDDGFLFLTGREGRFAKVFGLRVSLGDVESAVGGDVVAISSGESITIVHDSSLHDPAGVRHRLAKRFHLHHSAFKLQALESIPLTSSGKPNLGLLKEMFGGS